MFVTKFVMIVTLFVMAQSMKSMNSKKSMISIKSMNSKKSMRSMKSMNSMNLDWVNLHE